MLNGYFLCVIKSWYFNAGSILFMLRVFTYTFCIWIMERVLFIKMKMLVNVQETNVFGGSLKIMNPIFKSAKYKHSSPDYFI